MSFNDIMLLTLNKQSIIVTDVIFNYRLGCGLFHKVDGLRLLQVQVPAEVERGRSAVLGCRFEMEGDTLYSVKWYKGKTGNPVIKKKKLSFQQLLIVHLLYFFFNLRPIVLFRDS